jgi:hypothetical protein
VEDNGFIYRSDDGGKVWSLLAELGGMYRAAALDPSDPDVVYFGSTHKGVLKTSDGGRTWHQMNVGLTASSINELAVDPGNPQTVYAATEGGAFVSVDGGQHWWPIQEGLGANPVVYSIAVDPNDPSKVYAATPDGIFRLVGAPLEAAAAPILTPMGRIVYSDGKTGNDEIYVANSDGSDEQRLTDRPAGDWFPTWSPDGTRIVFTSDREATHAEGYQLYLMNADGSNPTRLTTRPDRNAKSASWSPDGSRIAFHSYCDLILMDADGSNWTILVEGGEDLCPDFPTWAPDGHRIAFRNMTLPDRAPPVQHDIYVVNDDGLGLLKLATLTSEDWSQYVVWSPDGSQVSFDILVDGQERYYTVNSDGSGEPAEIPSIPDSWYPWYWPQWAGEAVAAPTPAPVSPAEQVRAFAEPILAAIAEHPPDYADDFSDPGSGWSLRQSTEGEAGYEDGEYVAVAAPGYTSGGESSLLPEFSDFVLEIDARFVSGDDGNWGLTLRRRWENQTVGYGVMFRFSGEVEINRRGVGEKRWTTLTSIRKPFIKPGYETNHLQIIAKGAQIALAVNGEWATLVTDPGYTTQLEEGTIRLDAGNDGGGTPLRVQWDNLKIWDISDLALP